MRKKKEEKRCKKVLYLKIHLWSEANMSGHWSKGYNRKTYQQNLVAQKWYTEGVDLNPPVIITLTRMAPRTLDSDNLVTAFKSIRDRVASLLVPGKRPGRADNHPGIKWEYSQEKNKQYQVRIIIDPIEEKEKESPEINQGL